MKLWIILIFLLVLMVGCSQQIPPVDIPLNSSDPIIQEYKTDPNCPANQTGKYNFDGAQFHLADCKPFPTDLGKICSRDDDCEFNCITTDEDLIALGCPKASCPINPIMCTGIRGRCATYGKAFRSIPEENTVSVFCDE